MVTAAAKRCKVRPVAWLAAAFALTLPHGVNAQDALPERVSFYFAAHEDDWQLFMNPSAFMDVADPKTKTVFFHITAGDAGNGLGTRGRKHPYYLARENGAEVGIRFMADAGEQPVDRDVSRKLINGHLLYRVSYRSTVAYFLRVPDGNPEGTGYPGTGHQSLERLAKGEIKDFSTIDGSAVYHGWADLVATLRAAMEFERRGARVVQLNVAESNATTNPGDHSDHRMTAKAALEAAGDLACARRAYYIDYASSRLPENLVGQQRDLESSVLAATAAGILALDHASVWHPYHRSYLGRNYFRIEEGSGSCLPAANALQAASSVPTSSSKR